MPIDPTLPYDDDNIFARILRGELPCNKVYEDEYALAFHDIRPQAPVHLLVIPKVHIDNLYDARPEHHAMLGRMLGLAGELARGEGASDGFRVVINNGRVGRQEVYHLHIHVLGGPEPIGSGMPRH